jgi:AhpD family alkylhydroperoxidase
MTESLPGAAGALAANHPEIWEAYSQLGEACANSGPLTDREKRLVKLALAVANGSEGAVHSHTRRALGEGIEHEEIEQVALLGIGTLGLPRAVAALTWMSDITGT